jgi:hypothetical protein
VKHVLLLAALLLACTARAQTIEVKAGDSTLMNDAGVAATAYFPDATADGSVGLANGHVVLGADLKQNWHGWDVLLGDTEFNFTMPGSGLGLATRGVSFTKHNDKRTVTFFIGAAGQMYAAPYFQSVNVKNFGAGFTFKQQLTEKLEFTSMEVIAGNQKTASEGISYHAPHVKAEGGGGLLENRPYLFGNVAVQPYKPVIVEFGHSDSFYEGARFTVNNESGSLSVGALSFNANAFQGHTTAGSTAGQTVGMGARFGIFNANASYMRSAYGDMATGSLSEKLGQRFHLTEYATEQGGHLSITAGGGYTGNAATVDVSYQTYFMPLNVGRMPFQQALTVQLSFHAPHDVAMNASTYLLPNGKIRATVFGDTFTHGPFNGSAQGRTDEGNTGKYVVRLAVRDTDGAAVEGAAVYVGRALCATDATGNCFIRVKTGRSLPLTVAIDEFTAPGRWAAPGAPTAATPALEAAATPLVITVTSVR